MRARCFLHFLFVTVLTVGGLAVAAAETYRYAYAPGPLATIEPLAIRKFGLPGGYVRFMYSKQFASLRVASNFSRRPASLDPTRILDLEGMGFGFEVWSDPRGFQCTAPPLALAPLLLLYPALALLLQARRWLKTPKDSRTQCHECAYDLTGNESGVCPECGTAVGARPAGMRGFLRHIVKLPATAGVACGVCLFFSWSGIAAYGEWRANTFDPKSDVSTAYSEYIARLRAAGEPVTLHDIERRRPAIAKQDNGALILEELAEQLSQLGDGDCEGVLFFDTDLSKVDLFAGVPDSAIEQSRAFLQANEALVDRLGALAASGGGRLSCSYSEMATDPLGFQFPELAAWRPAAKLLALDAVIAVQAGDLDRAVNSIQLLAKLSATLDSDPTLITRLIQISIDGLAVSAMELLLRARELDRRNAGLLSDVLARRLTQDSLKLTLQFERATFFAICDGLAEGRTTMADVTGRERAGRMSVASVRENQVIGGELFDALIKVADDQVALSKAAHESDERRVKTAGSLGKRFGSHSLAVTLIPSVSRAVDLHNMCLARLRCAAVALAADRFWAQTGELPEKIRSLVPEYLDAVPSDPVNGEPLRLVVTDSGIVIYSVGDNLKDDGGSVVPAARKRRGLDIGFRLSIERGIPKR